jgi:hypothetical protein
MLLAGCCTKAWNRISIDRPLSHTTELLRFPCQLTPVYFPRTRSIKVLEDSCESTNSSWRPLRCYLPAGSGFPSWYFPLNFSRLKFCKHLSSILRELCARPYSLTLFDHLNNTRWTVGLQIMKLLIRQAFHFPSTSSILGPNTLLSTRTSLNCVLMSVERPSFRTQQNTGKIIILNLPGLNTHRHKLRGFSPPAKYTDRATAACWRI